MFKIFNRLFRRDQPAVRLPTTGQHRVMSDVQLLRSHFEVSKEAEDALARFATLVTEPLGTQESQRLADLTVAQLRLGIPPEDVINHTLLDELQCPGKWLMIQVDWKAADEVAPQAAEMLALAGITEPWQPQGQPETVVQALLALSAWVAQRGFDLLHLDLGDDAYHALLALKDKSEPILHAARDAGLKLQRSDEFEADNAR